MLKLSCNFCKKIVRILILSSRMIPEEIYWIKRCVSYNSMSKTKEAFLHDLMVSSHVLEKGITMPKRRLGFGFARIREILKKCDFAIMNFGADSIEIQSTLNDIEEYDRIHKQYKFQLPNDIQKSIDKLLEYRLSKKNIFSLQFTPEQFFHNCESFSEFAQSRHTCRHYSNKNIEIERIRKCIRIAQTAPSACNRQSTFVYIIASEEGKSIVRKYQNGSRGFGEFADKFLLITTEQYAWDIRQEKSGFIDAGIFTMNLLYALHEEHICACTLNAHLYRKDMKKFHKELKINESHYPVLFIALGEPTEQFLIARSERLNLNDICKTL